MTTTVTAHQGTLWDEMWWPGYPYATDWFSDGIRHESRSVAKGKRYVEANPPALSNLLVVDVDHIDAVLRSISSVGSHPLPNVVIENPRNGHAHAIWAMREPITRTEYARRKPLAYAAAVTEGLRRALDGDAGYSGLMTKNPLHEDWIAEFLHTDLHDLPQIEQALGDHMPPARWRETKKRRGDIIGLGRNCALFESARVWAYRELRNHWGDPAGLHAAILEEVTVRNDLYPEPLPTSEARAIAKSITKWITTRSRMWEDGPAVYEATFTTIQSARSRRASGKRTAGRLERFAALVEAGT